MAKRAIWNFDFGAYLQVWAENYGIRPDHKCPLCGQEIKLSKAEVEKVLRDHGVLETLEYWIRRYQAIEKLKSGLESEKIKSLVDLKNEIGKYFSFPAQPREAHEAGNLALIKECEECGTRYTIILHYRVDKKVFTPPDARISWLNVFKHVREAGDRKLDWELFRLFGAKYPELRAKILQDAENGDYGLLLDVATWLKKRLGIKLDFWLPRSRLSPELAASEAEFWKEFRRSGGYRKATWVPR